jgi:hypothetical protein
LSVCRCPTEGSEEDLNRRQQRKQRVCGWVVCDGHPVGHSATLRFFHRRRPRGLNGAAKCSGLCRCAGVDIAVPPQSLGSFDQCPTEGCEKDLNRRQQRKLRGLGLGFCDGHPAGHSATLRFFHRRRPRGLNGVAKCSGLCRCAGVDIAVPPQPLRSFDQCPTEGCEEDLNRRQQRKQRGLGLGFCDGHPVGPRRLWPNAARRGVRESGVNILFSLEALSAFSCQYAVQGNVSVRRFRHSLQTRKVRACCLLWRS